MFISRKRYNSDIEDAQERERKKSMERFFEREVERETKHIFELLEMRISALEDRIKCFKM